MYEFDPVWTDLDRGYHCLAFVGTLKGFVSVWPGSDIERHAGDVDHSTLGLFDLIGKVFWTKDLLFRYHARHGTEILDYSNN